MRRFTHAIALVLTAGVLTLAGCGGPTAIRPVLPENIGAEPRGLVGIVAPSPASSLPTALRALGVPYRMLPGDVDDRLLEDLVLVVVDELALDDLAVSQSLARLMDHTRTKGQPLIILTQTLERGKEVLRMNAAPFEPRAITHGVELVAAQRAHRVLAAPNAIVADDLERFSERTAQFVGGRNARAIIAGNAERPDSSAALLRAIYGKGALYYIAFPLAARAAEGHAAEQRLLANLVSLGTGD